MALTKLRGTNALYDKFRNGFAHDLGLQLDNAPTTRPGRRVRSRLPLMAPRIAVAKKPSLSDSELFELDDVIGRPAWLNPTVSKDAAAALVVDVPALYWGVRRLIFDYSNDARSVRSLEHMIKRTVFRRMKANLIETFTGT